MPVGQHDDLPVIPSLEEFFGAAVHIADDGFGRTDPLAVQDQPQPQDTVGRRVLRTDVEDHVLATVEFSRIHPNADGQVGRHCLIVPCKDTGEHMPTE